MRSRKCFVQIQVHHVHAKIAWTRNARQRVHVRAVHVKKRAAFVQDRRNFRDALFEHAQRARIREHQRGNIVGAKFAKMIGINLAARVRLDIFYFVARRSPRKLDSFRARNPGIKTVLRAFPWLCR